MIYNNNLLYYNNYLYKYSNSGNNISNLNVYNIAKKHFLNYFILLKYQILLINQVLEDKLKRKNAIAIIFTTQA